MRYRPGETLPPLTLRGVRGETVPLFDGRPGVVNLQFSRWAGCPICNLHIAGYRRRAAELAAAGVRVVMVFHSPAQDILDLRGELPFVLVADPDRRLYRAFGVGRSPFFLFNRRAWSRFREEAKRGNTAQRVHGGVLGLPADFVLDGWGRLLAVHYGAHADDSLGVDQVLDIARRAGDRQPRSSSPGLA